MDTQQCKEEFLIVLVPVSNNPAVKIELRTVAEAARSRATKTPVAIQEAEDTPNIVAADEDLRAYFGRQSPAGPTDELIRNYSSRMVNRAFRALFHAIELKNSWRDSQTLICVPSRRMHATSGWQ